MADALGEARALPGSGISRLGAPMMPGWIVRVEVEAGKGEIEPFLFVIALSDHRAAMAAAQAMPEVASPRVVLGGRMPAIHRCELIAPVRSETLQHLNLQPGNAWRL